MTIRNSSTLCLLAAGAALGLSAAAKGAPRASLEEGASPVDRGELGPRPAAGQFLNADLPLESLIGPWVHPTVRARLEAGALAFGGEDTEGAAGAGTADTSVGPGPAEGSSGPGPSADTLGPGPAPIENGPTAPSEASGDEHPRHPGRIILRYGLMQGAESPEGAFEFVPQGGRGGGWLLQRAQPSQKQSAIYGLNVALPEAGPKFIIGVSVSEVPAVVWKQLARDDLAGMVVDHVVDDSPAAHAGIEPFDILLFAGETSIHSAADLVEAVQQAQLQPLVVRLLRAGQERTLQVTPIENQRSSAERELLLQVDRDGSWESLRVPLNAMAGAELLNIGPGVWVGDHPGERPGMGRASATESSQSSGSANVSEKLEQLRREIAELRALIESQAQPE
jgi:hypothetical protein